VRRAQKFIAETKIQSKGLVHAIVILREPRKRRNPVVVAAHAAAGFSEERRALQKTLKIRAYRGRRKEYQSVVRHRQGAAKRVAIHLASEPQGMVSAGPAQGVEQHKAVAQSLLQLLRKRSKGKAAELQSVNVRVAVGGWQIDAGLGVGYRGNVV